MKIHRMRDMIDIVIAFHENLSCFYNDQKKKAERERMKILLDYMARHERHLMTVLQNYEDGASSIILDSWIHFAPESNRPLPCENISIQNDMTVDDVIHMAMEFDDCIIAIFQAVTDFAENEEVREAFSSLLKLERNSLKKFVVDAWRLVDR